MFLNLLKSMAQFLFEKLARDISSPTYDQILQKSIALVTVSDVSDEVMRFYLYEQRKALLRVRIWLLNQNQVVQGKTNVTATELQGSDLKKTCLEHLEEAQELLRQVRLVIVNCDPRLKINTGLFEVSSKAFLSLQFNGFVFSPKSLERMNRLKSR
jgi:hypothetical protein